MHRPTTLILGAGASCSYGFPVGSELRKQILAIKPDDGEALLGHGAKSVREFVKAFSRSQEDSIDAFLSRHDDFGAVGKAAIAHSIIEAERNTNVFDEENADNWCRYLLNEQLAPLGRKWDDFDPSWLSIVTFNYDRSLEYLLGVSLQHRYRKAPAEVLERLAALKIVHVYGSLGSPWEGDTDFLPYKLFDGDAASYAKAHWISGGASRIRVIPEGRDEDDSLSAAKELLARATKICVLGFGFDKTNLHRIGAPAAFNNGKRVKLVAATALGLTQRERSRAIRRVHGPSAQSPNSDKRFLDVPCRRLLRETLILDEERED